MGGGGGKDQAGEMNVDLAHLMYNAAQRQKAWVDGKVDGCVLQCVAVCCSVLQCVAVNVQRGAATEGVGGWQGRWLYAAVCCSVLQCAAVCCNVLQ